MATEGWTKYIMFFAVVSVIAAIVSVNPLGKIPSSIGEAFDIVKDMVGPRETPTSLEALARQYGKGCPAHKFTVKRLSRQPDMMLIEGFLTKAEADILVDLA
jgi:hypothetical protein